MKKFLLSLVLIITGVILLLFNSYKIFIKDKHTTNNTSFNITAFDASKKININNFAGVINLVKSDKDEIQFSDKIDVVEQDDEIYIELNGKEPKNSILTITYSDKFNIELENSVGKIYGEVFENSSLYINDYVGKIKLYTPENVYYQTFDLVGIFNKENVLFDNYATTKIIIGNSVSTVEIIKK